LYHIGHKDGNVKYVALEAMESMMKVDPSAVSRHRATIVGCLKEPDVSIRNRALDNTFLLLDEANVEDLMQEIVVYLGVAPMDQRGVLASRIADAVQVGFLIFLVTVVLILYALLHLLN
jgi:AP-1 complex subunit gamma-1